jgi:integral membrane protein
VKSPIPFLRRIAFFEGVSFLLLLCVAMPLKYRFDMPMAVKIVGWLHGILFIILCASLIDTKMTAKWSFGRTATIFIAALLPLGPFVVDRRMAAWDEEFRRGGT